MILWINGTYGVGKTSVANEIRNLYKYNSKVLEPDEIWMSSLKSNPKIIFGDGTSPQNNKNFIKILYSTIEKELLNYDGLLIVPMTITDSIGYDSLIERLGNKYRLKHVILESKKEIIVKRINKDKERDKSFALTYLDINIKFLENIDEAIHIDTSNLTPKEVAKIIINKVIE